MILVLPSLFTVPIPHKGGCCGAYHVDPLLSNIGTTVSNVDKSIASQSKIGALSYLALGSLVGGGLVYGALHHEHENLVENKKSNE